VLFHRPRLSRPARSVTEAAGVRWTAAAFWTQQSDRWESRIPATAINRHVSEALGNAQQP
jgi:hypothetical protein